MENEDGPIIIVRVKRANDAKFSPAESVEGRRSTKGNAARTAHLPDTAWGIVARDCGAYEQSQSEIRPYPNERLIVLHPRSEPYEIMLHVRIRAAETGVPIATV